jgi:hypothetical protein
MATKHQKLVLSEFLTEIQEKQKHINTLPPGDDRALAIEQLQKAINELLSAESGAMYGRNIARHIATIRGLLDKI